MELQNDHKCISQNCNRETLSWYCREHYLKKEMVYGIYDLRTNNKGFRWWGIKRIFNYYKYKLLS